MRPSLFSPTHIRRAVTATFVFVATSQLMFAPAAVAQDGGVAADATVPAARPVPAPSPRSPEGLLAKSVDDLAHGAVGAALKDDVKALRSGPLLVHGNYCGIGNRPGTAPIDALDAACMRHDACTKTGTLPSCGCDDRLRVDATAIADDPATAPDLKLAATATASAMAVLVCKDGPKPLAKPTDAALTHP